MDIFKNFRNKLIDNFKEMTKDVNHLYVTDTDKDELWETYLNNFPKGTNNLYKTRNEYDCCCCRQFIKAVGNVVSINNGTIKSIWDFDADSTIFQPVINALSEYVKSKNIKDVFFTSDSCVGTLKTFKEETDGFVNEFNHFYLEIPDRFKCRKGTVNDKKGQARDTIHVFKRSLDEISMVG